MSRTLVQSATGTIASGALSGTATLGAGATAGNILWCGTAFDKLATAITGPSGFTPVVSNASTSVSIYVGYKVAAGGETALTVSRGEASGSGDTIWVGEYSDTAGTSWSLLGSGSDLTNEGTRLVTPSGTTAATGAAGQALAFFAIDSGSNEFASLSYTNGFTTIRGWTNTPAGDLTVAGLADVPAGTAATTTLTATGTADQTSGVIVVFSAEATTAPVEGWPVASPPVMSTGPALVPGLPNFANPFAWGGELETVTAPEVTAVVAFAVGVGMTLAPEVTYQAAVPFAVATTVTVAGQVTYQATVPFAVSTALAAAGGVERDAAVTLAVATDLAVAGTTVTHPAAVGFAVQTALAVTGPTVERDAAVTFAAQTALTVTGATVTHPAAITLDVQTALVIAGRVTYQAAIPVAVQTALAITSTPTRAGVVPLAVESVLTVAALRETQAAAGLNVQTALGLAAVVQIEAAVGFGVAVVLDITGIRAATATVAYDVTVGLVITITPPRDITVTATLLPSPWDAELAATVWAAALQPATWAARLEDTMLDTSKEYLHFNLTADHDITADPAAVSFDGETTWHTLEHVAGDQWRVLVGPGVIALTPGTYRTVVKVTDTPEEPHLPAGRLRVH